MATILKQFDWTYVSRNSAVPRSRAYPWNEWLDGRIWQLEPGTDFDGPPVSLERVIRTTANRRGIKVRVRITDEGNVIVQKHEGDVTERGITKSPSLRSIKAAREDGAATVNGNGSKPAVKTSAPVKTAKRKIVKVTA
jgi:hypothetical protein